MGGWTVFEFPKHIFSLLAALRFPESRGWGECSGKPRRRRRRRRPNSTCADKGWGEKMGRLPKQVDNMGKDTLPTFFLGFLAQLSAGASPPAERLKLYHASVPPPTWGWTKRILCFIFSLMAPPLHLSTPPPTIPHVKELLHGKKNSCFFKFFPPHATALPLRNGQKTGVNERTSSPFSSPQKCKQPGKKPTQRQRPSSISPEKLTWRKRSTTTDKNRLFNDLRPGGKLQKCT